MNSRARNALSVLAAMAAGGAVTYLAVRARPASAPIASLPPPPPTLTSAVPPASTAGPPQLLYLPDGGDLAPGEVPEHIVLPGPWRPAAGACPEDMVSIAGAYCIDRYEASLVDAAQGRPISPYYHPDSRIIARTYGRWRNAPADGETDLARNTPVPAPPPWQLEESFEPRALSLPSVVPNGYLSRNLAERACANAGKRLCSEDEWVRACRGADATQFPYGTEYVQGRCNVFREAHPAAELHGNASINHTDPRLNKVAKNGRPLLRKTGATADCASRWGQDAVYDMVGNLDEWVADPDGVFVGGFYSRSTRAGCESKVSSHAPSYFDYSLGTRCCRSL